MALEVAADRKALLLVSVLSSPFELLKAAGTPIFPCTRSLMGGHEDRHLGFVVVSVETGFLAVAVAVAPPLTRGRVTLLAPAALPMAHSRGPYGRCCLVKDEIGLRGGVLS